MSILLLVRLTRFDDDRVERVLGTLKRSYGFRRGRYMGLERTKNQALLLCMAFNMRKMTKLLPVS